MLARATDKIPYTDRRVFRIARKQAGLKFLIEM